MDCYGRLAREVEEYGANEAGIRVTEALVRLTQHYQLEKLENIITGCIKGEIFVYVLVPGYYSNTPKTKYLSSELSLQILPSPSSGTYLPDIFASKEYPCLYNLFLMTIVVV